MDFASVVTLEDEFVRLEPLSPDHAAGLAETAADMERPWYTVVPAPDEVPDEISRRLALRDAGSMNPFAIRRLATGRLVGMTTFCNIDQSHRRTELGYTWLGREAQGTEVNPAVKRLLLAHAFEACDAISVQLFTHVMNHQSRAAIERLGAKLDGVLRSHRIMADGSLRDTAVYSILPHEWPAVRNGLDARLARRSVR
ncbi:RimJ/RimL family protein N-acetyltransferase [Microbacterium resistens]|uniref:RimJ/RimL family protein N-acetyltransferase n=1 Tax=Microbacterium resistens TaxID=156977 RepID=A0ABU1SBK9_9MICO|nr:GNAT family protein [Microbacterium resistens]MDR6866272.1 RimJ/RimL family protein N-acetyltransferase [Microbacterium resistens]